MNTKAAVALSCLAASFNLFNLQANAHTRGAGAVFNSEGSFTIWYGTYNHGSPDAKQGSVTVTSGGSSTTQAIDIIQSTTPTGIDYDINFFSNRSNYSSSNLTLWQGTTFSSIQSGVVQFEFTDCTQGVDCPGYRLNWVGGGAVDNMQFSLSSTGVSSFSTLVSGGEIYGFDGRSVPTVTDDGDASFSISGDRYVGKTLSAARDSDDPDGNGSITGYTWQSSSDGSTWSTVGTDSTYALTGSEEGKYLRLTVAYTDGESFSESVTTSNVQAKDFTIAMAKPFAALKSNNLEIINSYVKNSLLSSQQSCTSQGVEIFDGKVCIHGNYFHTNRYTFGDSGNNSFQAHQTAGNMASTIK